MGKAVLIALFAAAGAFAGVLAAQGDKPPATCQVDAEKLVSDIIRLGSERPAPGKGQADRDALERVMGIPKRD